MKKVFENADFLVEEHEESADEYDGLTITDKSHGIKLHIEVNLAGVDVSSWGNDLVSKLDNGERFAHITKGD